MSNTKQSQETLILQELKRLNAKVDNLESEDDDLELNFSMNQSQNKDVQYSQMLNISPDQIDGFGDSIELTTKSRLKDDAEAFKIAQTVTAREYHTMLGNRYGKHSKLIPVVGRDGKKTKVDNFWLSGSKIQIVEYGGIQYYKIRMLVYDILVKKLLLARIPTDNGSARQEEINLHAAKNVGNQRLAVETANIQPMQPIKYKNNEGSDIDNLYEVKN